jgi:hypothetical protein
MATKNKKKKQSKSKTQTKAAKAGARKRLAGRKSAQSAKLSRKRSSKRKVSKAGAAKARTAKKKKRIHGKHEEISSVNFEPKGLGARSGGQSGDLQGLSNIGRADSESVDELLEEGNAFEAEIVKGVEDVSDADESEVRTHEVPEDDVPEEYLEKDE